VNKRSSVGAITSSGSLRDGLEISVKCHVTEGESRPIPFKNGLSVRFGSDDSGTPMWRAYGGMNGVALVMNNAPFQATEPSDVLKIYASPVAYFDAQKFAEKFGEIVRNIEDEASFLKQQDQEEIKARIFRMLAFAAVCTKHPGFTEEVEWRVLHAPWWESSAYLKKEIEVVQGVPQPVYKIPLKDIPEAGLFGITIPALIDRIIIGPTRDPLAIVEAFADLLAKADVEEPYKKIFVSNIPLRQ